jgi:hypothetical protein
MTKLTAIVFAATTLFSSAAFADTRWERNHPRRDQVNDRLENQHDRIAAGVASGQLTKREATRLRSEDRAIRAKERAMAARNGGHITPQQQERLNRRQDRVSQQIYAQKHDAQVR